MADQLTLKEYVDPFTGEPVNVGKAKGGKNRMVQKSVNIQNEPKPQIEINIDKERFIVRHICTGTQTIQEVYEDFLKRKLNLF